MKADYTFVAAGLATLLLCSSTRILAQNGDQAKLILIDKSERAVTIVYADGRRILLKGARFGAGWKKGPKRASGDEKTPEGDYHVLERRENGAYQYIPALYLDYPNAADRSASNALGVNPGGDILIHGPPKEMPFGIHPPGNWTDGCVALTPKQMRKIMEATKVGTPVTIIP